MAKWLNEVEDLTLKGQIKVPYTWSVGETGSRFLVALRDRKTIIANRCGQCGTVFVPPRKNCGRCFLEIREDGWQDVSSEGEVTAFTIIHSDSPIHPCESPFSIALIKLDGTDVDFTHIIKGNLDQLTTGIRVKAVFADNRQGLITDIDCFEII